MPVYPTFFFFEEVGLACTNLASQPYLFLVGGAKGKEKYVCAFRATKECNNCIQRLQVKCMVCNFKHLSSLVILFCVACAHTGKLS